MPVSPPTEPTRAQSIDAIPSVDVEPRSLPTPAEQGRAPERVAQVSISLAGREALTRSETAGRVLDAIEKELGLLGSNIEEAGREDFLDRISSPERLSSEATAERIHDGIITYLYGAFRLENPESSRAQLEQFAAATLRGLDRGLRDAANLLVAFGARRERVAAERAEIFHQVRDKMAEFVEQQIGETGRQRGDHRIEETGRQRGDHRIHLPELDLLGS